MSQVKPRGSPRFRYNPITVTGPVLVLLLLSPALPASASDAAPRQAPGQAAPAAAPDFDQLLARAMELHKGGDLGAWKGMDARKVDRNHPPFERGRGRFVADVNSADAFGALFFGALPQPLWQLA